jgi:hypothetical protein
MRTTIPCALIAAGAAAAGAGSAACCFIAASFACTLLSTTVALIWSSRVEVPPVSSGVSRVPLSSRASTASACAWVRAILSWARCIIIAASLVCSPMPARVSPAVLVALAASYEALSDSRWVANDCTLAWYF